MRFEGTFAGRAVNWHATVLALGSRQAIACTRQYIEIEAHTSGQPRVQIGLHVDRIDRATLLKTVVMVRNYKRLRHGRIIFGDPSAGCTLHRIISGGQTGVDRAALDVALDLGIECGGSCPRGRRAEDGPIPTRYPLTETAERDYRARTARNVKAADATLILTRGPVSGGTAYTERLARDSGKPHHLVDLAVNSRVRPVREWLRTHSVQVLNVAGPRESGAPGVHRDARRFLMRLFAPP